MATPLKVLLVEDSEDDGIMVVRELRRGGYEPIFKRVDTPEAMVAELEKESWDIIISDYVMPQFNGLNALRLMQGKGLDLPFIVVSGKAGEETLVGAMKAGVHDYILKDNLARLATAVERELREVVVRRERKRAEEALEKSREEAQRLAHENAILANIGRIINSTLSIEEVFKLFSEEARKLISFDRIAITLANAGENTLMNRYVDGIPVFGRAQGDVFPKMGTATEAVMNTRKDLIIQGEDETGIVAKFPGVQNEFEAGLKSMMSVPLVSGDQIIGALHLRSKNDRAYSERDLKLAESVANQIAGAIVNSQLFDERKRSEEALSRSIALLRSVLNALPVGVSIWDKEGKFLSTNPARDRIWGSKRFLGIEQIGQYQGWWADTGKKLKAEDWALSRAIKKGETSVNEMIHIESFDGSRRTILNSAVPIRDSSGEIIWAIGVDQDITELRQAEELLKRSEEESKRMAREAEVLAQIGRIISSTLEIEVVYERFAQEAKKLIEFDRISVNIINWKENTISISYVWGTAIAGRQPGDIAPLIGSPTEEMSKTRSSLLIQTEDEDELATRFPVYLPNFQGGLRSALFAPLIVKDDVIGSLAFFLKKPNAYTDCDRKLAESVGYQIAGAIANANLFSKVIKAEEELRKEKDFNQTLIQLSPFFYVALNPAGKILTMNETMLNRLGYTLKEVLGQDCLSLCVPAAERARVQSFWQRWKGQGEMVQNENHVLGKEGQDFLVEWHGKWILKDNGDLDFFFAVGIDITGREQAEKEKRSLEEQMRAAQKMEAIGELASGIAHDFNNSLTLISVCSQLALFELKGRDPLREKIETIRAATERSANLCHQLLAFSRRQVMEIEVFNLNILLKDLNKILHRLMGENVSLGSSLEEDLGLTKADPGQIEQVVINLVVNARDAMPNGGSLMIETANVELGQGFVRAHPEVVPGSYVLLAVSDTGPGMTPEIAERAFEPFFTTKEKGKGTGLGLSTVYGIVKQSKGYIYLDSEPGVGTTFRIYLPRADEPLREEKREREMQKESLPRVGETILVVEDEKEILLFTSMVLRRQGYKVLEVSGAGDAVLLCEKHTEPIDLMLTDVVMPGMGGRELADRLLRTHPEMRVLYMSGYSDKEIAPHGVIQGVVNFLQKPFTIEGLTAKVRKVLD